MSARSSKEGRSNPFSPRAALALVLFGVLSFIVLLWVIGSGMGDPEPGAKGSHVGGKGLDGYAAFATYLEQRGYGVKRIQSRGALRQGGLLVLTPTRSTSAKELAAVIDERRDQGPTILIMPKWIAAPLPPAKDKAKPKPKQGFVQLVEAIVPDWRGFHDEVGVRIDPLVGDAQNRRWEGFGTSGTMPQSARVLWGGGGRLVPLVLVESGKKVLAGYFADGGDYPALRAVATMPEPVTDDELYEEPSDEPTGEPTGEPSGAASDAYAADAAPPPVELPSPTARVAPLYDPEKYARAYPVILVFEPDLLNNYGMAQQTNAVLGERLVQAALAGKAKTVNFDLTLDGYGRSQNLLELAFKPPFLAATLCLLLAAMVALWRAFNRFGPPLLTGRSIAFGKHALVSNAAGLLRRARRLHLVGAPYADAARERLVKALALPARLDPAQAEKAIDRALAARDPSATPFSAAAAQLREAKGPRNLLRAAQALHSLERTLTQ